ncbi:MAG: hypothetical protein H7138_15505, partial [Myxococcales bacterium]|nr:hypothetical protein [Myxococcales bacterium]
MRVACLDLPAFPLQLVWRQQPAWRTHPVVVIERDRPHGEVLWACERARASGIQIGHRYSHALALCSGLRARVVPASQIAEATIELRTVLKQFSPGVEPGDPGTFWLDGEGLDRIFPETGTNVGRNAGTDVGRNAGTDVGRNAGTDVGTDVGRNDGTGVGTDAGRNVGTDAGRNAGTGVGRNAGTGV